MGYIGLSIILASLTFFCYKHPPSSWLFLSWYRENGLESNRDDTRAPAAPTTQWQAEKKNQVEDAQENLVEINRTDRAAMPPPPPPRVRKAPASMATTSISPVAPTSLASPTDLPSLSPPLFPARNSIQRASGGQGPPRLHPIPAVQPPLRSPNSLMPPPIRSPLPNRASPFTNSLSLAPPPTHNAIPPKPRTKVQLSPGHSPLDWAHYSSSPNANLRGLPPSTPYLRVPPSLLRQYTGRKGKDAWTILGGKVYNITPYLPYHPGGEPELLRAAGRDGSKLFGEVHPWVNWEGMLESCLVGVAVGQEEIEKRSQLEDMD